MYHHHSQQQGSQPFANGPRPPHHQSPQNQHQNRSASDMRSQVMGFQFPRPTQLPDELESALAIRGARDMDHRLIDHMSRPNQHQNQGSGSGIGQHGSYGSNPGTLTSDNQPAHQQGVDWSSYQPPTKLFASPLPSASHQPQRHQGPQQQPESNQAGTSIPGWTASVSGSPSPQARHTHGGGDGQGLYTPESAGSILASFGLSNEDLEVLSHYPDDQLTPDTLPFILRDIQINKSGNQKTAASTSASPLSRSIHDVPLSASSSSTLACSGSSEVPSLLTVTQTAGKVIDYGHASRAKDENSTRETFKREQLSGERTVKMYPTSSPTSSAPKTEKVERRQEPKESSKHGDQDYRRTNSDHRKNNRSPGREFPPSSKSRNLDQDYRHDRPKLRPSSETRSEASSRRSLSSSSGSKPQGSSKKLPTPTMRSDFSAVSPKVYPHTCSLCHTQCDQEKDWIDHINTVNHTAACRDLRNRYPDWKPNLPSRSGRYGSRALWDPKDQPLSRSVSRSISHSPSPPHSKYRVGPHPHRPQGRPYSPHHHPRHHHYTGFSSRSGLKRPHDDSTSRHPFSSKALHSSKHGLGQSSSRTAKGVMRPGIRTTKTASAKAIDTSAKPPLAKKKKKVVTPTSQDSSVADRLVFLTGIPKDATEQEVTDLVGSFGKINNVILMPCSVEEDEKGEGQKASVCMVKAEHAQALADSTSLSIRDQQITASIAKKPEAGHSSDAKSSKPAPGPDNSAGREADQKTSDEKSMVLITGLPESDWSESDIIELFQPYGTPSNIILASQIGKVLVSVPDVDIAEEIVKVNSVTQLKIKDCELKMTHLKQCIGLDTPVALYNLLMGKVDPSESSVPVGWSSLLVISNVPNTPSGPSEVQKLVRRFGTVIKTLVLNSMVICEMATAAMALSVYKRFQTFPCIIQNNPLFFSRKPDPKANAQTKVIAAYLDSPEDAPANGKPNQTAAAPEEEESEHKEKSESPSEGKEKDTDGKEETMKSTDKMAVEDELAGAASDSLAAPDTKPEANSETDDKKTTAVETVETTKETEGVSESEAGNEKKPAGEETKPTSSDSKAASEEMPELPKVTQEMVNALLVECRTRTASHQSNTAASTNGEQEETQMETEQAEKTAEETKEPAKNQAEEELKKQEKERKEREARKAKEARERRERERRAWEKEKAKKEREREERARREREKREEERRQWERRERARRERKRGYDEGPSEYRSSGRSEEHKRSSWREEHPDNSTKKAQVEDFDEFPFNLSDFVTVDEVGDVTDLPGSPSPTVPDETTEERDERSSPLQKEAPEDTTMEVSSETGTEDAKTAQTKSDEHMSDSEPATVPTAETSDSLVSSDLTPGSTFTSTASPTPAPKSVSSPSQTPVATCQSEAPHTETTQTADLGSTTDAEAVTMPAPPPSATPADSTSDGPATVLVTAGGEEDKTEDCVRSQAEEKEETVADKTEEHQKTQDGGNKEVEAPAAETGKHESNKGSNEAQITGKTLQTEAASSTENPLPPFNPSNPVGMEFLVPKTGFFCKVCNRFFSGGKEAELNHCKTLKHYNNLQNYMQTTKLNATT